MRSWNVHDLLDFLCRSSSGDFVVASTAVAAAGNHAEGDEEEDENDGNTD